MTDDPSSFPYEIGMVLSGGGARGIAHVGVLRAFNENGIFPSVISGSSAGSIVGALYADGLSPAQIIEASANLRFINIIRFSLPRHGLFRLEGVVRLFKNLLRSKNFEDLQIPLFVNATNFSKGTLETFDKGELLRPVVASASIPVLFQPIMIKGQAYMDSGLIDNLPVSPLKNKCRVIVGVNANPLEETYELGNMAEVIDRAVRISYSENVRRNRKHCDLYIEPHGLEKFQLMDLSKAQEIEELGYQHAQKVLERNKHLLF